MSTDISRLIYRPSVGRYVDRHIGRVSVDISADTSVDYRSICRPIVRSRGAQNTLDPPIIQNVQTVLHSLRSSRGSQKLPVALYFAGLEATMASSSCIFRVIWHFHRENLSLLFAFSHKATVYSFREVANHYR